MRLPIFQQRHVFHTTALNPKMGIPTSVLVFQTTQALMGYMTIYRHVDYLNWLISVFLVPFSTLTEASKEQSGLTGAHGLITGRLFLSRRSSTFFVYVALPSFVLFCFLSLSQWRYKHRIIVLLSLYFIASIVTFSRNFRYVARQGIIISEIFETAITSAGSTHSPSCRSVNNVSPL